MYNFEILQTPATTTSHSIRMYYLQNSASYFNISSLIYIGIWYIASAYNVHGRNNCTTTQSSLSSLSRTDSYVTRMQFIFSISRSRTRTKMRKVQHTRGRLHAVIDYYYKKSRWSSREVGRRQQYRRIVAISRTWNSESERVREGGLYNILRV